MATNKQCHGDMVVVRMARKPAAPSADGGGRRLRLPAPRGAPPRGAGGGPNRQQRWRAAACELGDAPRPGTGGRRRAGAARQDEGRARLRAAAPSPLLAAAGLAAAPAGAAASPASPPLSGDGQRPAFRGAGGARARRAPPAAPPPRAPARAPPRAAATARAPISPQRPPRRSESTPALEGGARRRAPISTNMMSDLSLAPRIRSADGRSTPSIARRAVYP